MVVTVDFKNERFGFACLWVNHAEKVIHVKWIYLYLSLIKYSQNFEEGLDIDL
jgi:hypothetical protein